MLLEFILYYEVEVLVSLPCHCHFFYTLEQLLDDAYLYYKLCMWFIMGHS